MSSRRKTETEYLKELQALRQRATDLEKINAELKESEQRFRVFAETSFEGIALADDGIFVDLNEQLASMVGYSREELIGKSVLTIVSPESHELARDAIRTNRLEPYKISGLHKDGSPLKAEILARSAQIGERQVRATAIRNITEQERVQSELVLSEKRFSTAFHTSPDSININRLSDGLYLEINQGFTNITGYESEEVLGKTSIELDIWADPEDREKLVRGLRERGGVTNLEARFRMKNGNIRTGLMSARIIEINNERCILSVTRDVTERKEAQERIRLLNEELLAAYDETLEGWSRALNLRDPNTDGHSKRVVDMTLQLARIVGIAEANLVPLRRGAILHDIGKMGIPDHILLKPGPLSEDEWRIMRLHPVFAYEMLSKIPFLKASLDIPYCHHEKWDGTGYPRGLKEEEIPLAARVFSIVDTFDALVSDRSYRPAWSKENALGFIQEKSGIYFEPDIVGHFLKLELIV